MVRCPECGLVFQHPQPGDEASASLYYDSPAFAARLEGELRATTIARAREKLALLARAGVAPPGTALDVGCSSGAWLELAKDTGWDPVGVEIGTAVAAAARRRGFEVHTGSLSDADLAGRRFDLVTFWDVLEHLPDPLDALIRARRLLRPGGVVALTFPNVEGFYPRATRRLIAERTGVWEHAELPNHLFDFSPHTARVRFCAAPAWRRSRGAHGLRPVRLLPHHHARPISWRGGARAAASSASRSISCGGIYARRPVRWAAATTCSWRPGMRAA